ncbi:MAG: MFS transporter [Leptolyngbyaceae cyanobacterium SM1_3_5]|nr:MFS transporter [Leptolyngbyaceae cyanobacterium SM1_3_5]
MAIASGATVANLYYNQPLLAVIAQDFDVSTHEVSLIPTLTQLGYATGILLIVPLGDRTERRRLIVVMTGCTAIALALAAISPNLPWLAVASFAIGVTAIAAQIIVPFAAQLAAPAGQSKVVGMVMSGLFIGILLARLLSGYLGAILPWQAVYWIGSGLMLGLAIVLLQVLPRSEPALQLSYPRLMASLWLIAKQPALQTASIVGAMSFGAFSAFWTTLVFLLNQPPYNYGSEVAGLFGLVGLVGALAAPQVGKIADRRSPFFTLRLGILTSAIAFTLFWIAGHHLGGLVLGVILLDLGVQTTQISNQTSIYRLPAELHSRLNALYIMFYFIGGAIGSYLSAFGWTTWEWSGVCALSLGMLAIGFAALTWRKPHNSAIALK